MSEPSVWDDLFEAVFGGWPEMSEPTGQITGSLDGPDHIQEPEVGS